MGGYERNDAVLSLADIVSSDGFKTAGSSQEMSGVDIFRYDSTINFMSEMEMPQKKTVGYYMRSGLRVVNLSCL